MTSLKRVVAVVVGTLALTVGAVGAASAEVGPQESYIRCC